MSIIDFFDPPFIVHAESFHPELAARDLVLVAYQAARSTVEVCCRSVFDVVTDDCEACVWENCSNDSFFDLDERVEGVIDSGELWGVHGMVSLVWEEGRQTKKKRSR